MAEGLGLAASIIAVLQITNSVISVCYDYNAAVQGASWELPQVRAEMESLRDVLQALEPLAKQAEFTNSVAGTRLPTLSLLMGPDSLLQNCFHEVERLEKRLKSPSWSDGFGSRRKALMQALRWPLKEAETKKALENISRFKSTLVLALSADSTTLELAIQDLSLSTNGVIKDVQRDFLLVKNTTLDMQREVKSTKDEMRQQKIHRWLSSPDPSTNHNRARRSRQENTGSWFLESKTYAHWQEQKSLLWLHGKAGCGKTVLSSTIIVDVFQKCLKQGVTAVYFYFDFNDLEKQRSDKMLRSLIMQLSGQSTQNFGKLELLHTVCANGDRQPDSEELINVLKDMMEGFDDIYVVLDALDECSERQTLLDRIEEINGWGFPLHMLLTSRRLTDIEERIEPITEPPNRLCIQSTLVDTDILTYVHHRLQIDRQFKRWRNKPHVQEEIKTTLMRKADGMFRWAVCQLDILQNCLSLPTLRKALASLPKTLDETYARILCDIPEDHSQYAVKILQWLSYSARPLRVEELAEIVAINTTGNPWFDPENRFPEQREILTTCSSLVTIEKFMYEHAYVEQHAYDEEFWRKDFANGDSRVLLGSKRFEAVRLAHFSVKEYLVSERIREQAAAKYAIQEIPANASIAETCLAYLLHFDREDSLTIETLADTLIEYPLLNYATHYWIQHVRTVGESIDQIKTLCLELCLNSEEAYSNWVQLYNRHDFENYKMVTPLYYASLAGAIELARLLLNSGADVNTQSGFFGTALQAASVGGHEAIVRLLLNRGADVNTQGKRYASLKDNKAVIRLLLENGADVNAQCGRYSNALQAGSWEGHEAVVQLLLDNGADINAQGGPYGNAIEAASSQGHETVVRLLQSAQATRDSVDPSANKQHDIPNVTTA